VPEIVINDTINLFLNTAISILVISNHNSSRLLLDTFASVYFIWKYLYFSIGNGQPGEPALCQLYRYNFVPYWRYAHRSRFRILLFIFLIHEFYWILKMLTKFYFKIQYFNFDWKITITLLHSHRNIQQWKVRLKSVLFRVRISNSPLFPFNSCFNLVHNQNVLQFNHKTYQ